MITLLKNVNIYKRKTFKIRVEGIDKKK